jgi:polar amino acid transport system substrate-binding protein
MNKMLIVVIKLLVLLSVPFSGYGSDQPTSRNDLLAKIMARGTIILAVESYYPPQSELKPEAIRAANTKCAPTEYTASEVKGFDIDTAIEIARRLGVEPCFVTPPWTQVTAGNWSERWDLNVDSMTITQDRMKVLYFTQPYYVTPAAVFVHKSNNAFSQPSDLSGKRIGACTGCTYDYYLQGTLVLPGSKFEFVIKDRLKV